MVLIFAGGQSKFTSPGWGPQKGENSHMGEWDQNQQGLWGPTKVGVGSGPTKGRSVLAQILFRIIMCCDNKKKSRWLLILLYFLNSPQTMTSVVCLGQVPPIAPFLHPSSTPHSLLRNKDFRFRDLPPWTVPYYYYYYYYYYFLPNISLRTVGNRGDGSQSLTSY